MFCNLYFAKLRYFFTFLAYLCVFINPDNYACKTLFYNICGLSFRRGDPLKVRAFIQGRGRAALPVEHGGGDPLMVRASHSGERAGSLPS